VHAGAPARREPTYSTRPSPSAICRALGTRATSSIEKPGGSFSRFSGRSAAVAAPNSMASINPAHILAA